MTKRIFQIVAISIFSINTGFAQCDGFKGSLSKLVNQMESINATLKDADKAAFDARDSNDYAATNKANDLLKKADKQFKDAMALIPQKPAGCTCERWDEAYVTAQLKDLKSQTNDASVITVNNNETMGKLNLATQTIKGKIAYVTKKTKYACKDEPAPPKKLSAVEVVWEMDKIKDSLIEAGVNPYDLDIIVSEFAGETKASTPKPAPTPVEPKPEPKPVPLPTPKVVIKDTVSTPTKPTEEKIE